MKNTILDELRLGDFFVGGVGVEGGKGHADAEGWGAGESGRGRNVSFDEYLKSYQVLRRDVPSSRSVAGPEVFDVVISSFLEHLVFPVVADFHSLIEGLIAMPDGDGVGVIFSDGDEAVFFNGGGQDPVAFVVDVLSDDIDSTWGSRDELWRVGECFGEEADQVVVAGLGVSGVKALYFRERDHFEHG